MCLFVVGKIKFFEAKDVPIIYYNKKEAKNASDTSQDGEEKKNGSIISAKQQPIFCPC